MRLKELRERAGLTQTELGELVGLTRSAISNIEKGKNGARQSTLTLLAEVLKASVEEILTNELQSQHPTRGITQTTNSTTPSTENLAGVNLPFITHAEFSLFAQQCASLQAESFPTLSFLPVPGHDYQDAVVLEIRGNSMAPRYPERARFVLRPIAQNDWSQAQGVHAIVTGNVLRIKRIVSNLNSVLRLRSDANGEEMEVLLADVTCLWKVGEATYIPAED
jgi:transcriptional regulator with XRE-family HTH domain